MKKLLRYVSLSIGLFGLSSACMSKTTPEAFRQSFNDLWKFQLGDAIRHSQSDLDESSWRSVTLPHDWSIEGKPDRSNPSGNDGGYFPTGTGWYRKSFQAPPAWKGKNVQLYFEGIYMNAEVYLNGRCIAKRPYGYSSFFCDLSSDLQPGTTNVLAVRVDNSQQKNCRWYSGSGIYRPVWLSVSDAVHLAPWGLSVTTPVANEREARVSLKSELNNSDAVERNFTLQTTLFDPNGRRVASSDTLISLLAGASAVVNQNFKVAGPRLWSPETPNLYRADVRLTVQKKVLDAGSVTLGIRTLNFSSEKGFQLNGRTYKLNGGCVHHDNGCLGAASFARAEERRVELLKKAGFNAVRTSHNIPSEAFLDACDRLGMLVIDEAFDGWRDAKTPHDYASLFDAWWKRDLETMVLRDRNHPSIIIWSIGNEIIERKKPEAVVTARNMAACIKAIDTTRPVTSAITTWDSEWERYDTLFAAHDVAGYNYQMHRVESDHKRVPDRLIVQTESYPRDAFSNWDMVDKHDYLLGDFVWTALDYLGESGIGRWYYKGETRGEHYERDQYPWHGAYCGDLDLMGQRKPISYYRSLLYNPQEPMYLAVREPEQSGRPIRETLWSVWPTWESWTWPGHEGKDIQVEVYSRHPKVQLYLNDKLVGEQSTTRAEAYKATFTLPYAPGVLKAVGMAENRPVETRILETAGSQTSIALKPDRTKLRADGQDLSFVLVEIQDAQGRLQPVATNLLTFELTGPGVLAGVDNADLTDSDSYCTNARKAWHGKALVVVRSTGQKGSITLTVRSKGLETARVQLKTK